MCARSARGVIVIKGRAAFECKGTGKVGSFRTVKVIFVFQVICRFGVVFGYFLLYSQPTVWIFITCHIPCPPLIISSTGCCPTLISSVLTVISKTRF